MTEVVFDQPFPPTISARHSIVYIQMIRRHMRSRYCTDSGGHKPRMRSNAIAVKEDFYRAAGHPDIDLCLILIGQE